MGVDELTGQDPAYWVSRANAPTGSNRFRRHYGEGLPQHDPMDEPHMRRFVAEIFGPKLPQRSTWP